ncbi:MAG TPA: T9SS type A sorting domain-containing protein [bacterium]|nr:T9SS type A sorting domain-containing protein [bacterium]
MYNKHTLWLLLVALLLVFGAAANSQTITRPDVIWARTSDTPITLDGVLNEAAWAQAESIHVVYGQTDAQIPGSGWAKEGGVEASDPMHATLKFLIHGNSLYLAVTAMDSSVGGGLWAKFDAILMNIRNAADPARPAGSFEYFYGWVAESWADPNTANVGAAPGFFGMAAGDRAVWDAVTVVNGVSNDDAAPDAGYTTEFKFDLAVRGYDATAAAGTVIPFNISIYDCDWQWPLNEAKFSSNRVWLQGPWGNGSAYAVLQIHADPAVTLTSAAPYVGPDFIVPNADTHPEPAVDGVLDEAAWASAPSLDLRYGDDALRASYGPIGSLLSGQWQPEVGGVKASILDPADATIKWFTREDVLYLAADVRDQAVWSLEAYDQWDGIRFIVNDIAERDANDHNLLRRDLTVRLDPTGQALCMDHLAFVIDSLGMGSAAVTLKSGTTVNDYNDIDAGYLIEIAVDLKALGYKPGLPEGNLFISATLFDGDNFPNAADNYGQRVWWMREGGWNATPAWGYMDPYTTLPGGTVAVNERPDAIWARTTSAAINLDGKMDEAVWEKAESVRLRYGRNGNLIPGSGSVKEGGVDPVDPTDATLKFVVKENKLYMGVQVKDASIGGGPWARFDAFLFNIRDHSNANRPADSFEFFYGWVAESWADPNTANPGAAPGFFGRAPADRDLWNGATFVAGTTNDDAAMDEGYSTELVFDLAKLGYDVTRADGEIIEFNFALWDADWLWPLDEDKFSSNRCWWQGPWGNASAYAIARIHAHPAVTEDSALPMIGPDLVVPNGADHPAPAIDGLFDESVWANVKGLDLRFGDDDLRASYPAIAPWRSGQFQPEIDSKRAPVLDPADATLKWFFKDHMLYVSAEFRDQSVSGMETYDMWDGLRLVINDRAARDAEDVLMRRNLTVRVGPTGPVVMDYLETLVNEGKAHVGFALKPGSTINDVNDIDAGYHMEMAIDLTALGYPADLGDRVLFISATIFDGDTFPNTADNYGQRVWFMRESDWPAGPAWALMDPKAFVPGDPLNTMERPDALWARVASAPITLDGKMDEADWANAEAVVLRYGSASLIPGSGFGKEGGVDPSDPTFATLKFLVHGNKLFVGAEVKDASVGGGPWARFDAILLNIRNHAAADRPAAPFEYFYGWVAESWADPNTANVGAAPGFFGWAAGDRTVWDAVTVVNGITNDDATPDNGYTTEFVFDLTARGYDITRPGGDIIEFNVSIYDCDWFWPINDDKFSSNRVWWQGPWGNNSAYAIAQIHADPAVTVNSGTLPVIGPDLIIPNGADFPAPVTDGSFDEAVWSKAPGFDLRFGDDELRASYPGIAPWRSGQFQPEIDSKRAPVLDPADATLKWFFKDHMLYVSAEFRDQSVSGMETYDMWDGLRLVINDRAARDAEDVLMRRNLTVRVGPTGPVVMDYLETLVNEGKAHVGFALKPGSTINDVNDIDAGYHMEMAIDLTAFGYPADLGDGVLFVSACLFDGDTFPNAADNYGQRVWFMRESDWPAGPAWALMDPQTKLTGVKIDPASQLPKEFALIGNYPNPFNPVTTIQYAMPEDAVVTLQVYDLLGRMVAEMALGRQSAGIREISFDAARISSGVYFYRLEMVSVKAKKTVRTGVQKMLVIK